MRVPLLAAACALACALIARADDCPVSLVSSADPHRCNCLRMDADTPPWADGGFHFCSAVPEQWHNATYFSCPHCMGAGVQMNVTCPSNWEACEMFILTYHCPGCSGRTNGGWVTNLPGEGWRPSSCAPNFCDSQEPPRAHPMVAHYQRFPAGKTAELPATLTAPSLYWALVVQEGKVCEDVSEEAQCDGLCQWTDGRCATAWCQHRRLLTDGGSIPRPTVPQPGHAIRPARACQSFCAPTDCGDGRYAPPGASYDLNNDGRLDWEEFAALARGHGLTAYGDSNLEEAFAMSDLNSNGHLELEEARGLVDTEGMLRLRVLHLMLDKDGSGAVSLADYKQGARLNAPGATDAQIEADFRNADLDANGELDLAEIVPLVGWGSGTLASRSKAFFIVHDRDNDGALQLGELTEFFGRFGGLTAVQVQPVLAAMDQDSSGGISPSEFHMFWKDHPAALDMEHINLFQRSDSDPVDGQVTKAEYLRYSPRTDIAVDQLFSEFDTDGDDKLNYLEFGRAVEHDGGLVGYEGVYDGPAAASDGEYDQDVDGYYGPYSSGYDFERRKQR
eukprot:TRINITY_DN9296_c0_g2_i1.p1 TRINITY_DN9296_c0_g2~~TRINITY_DN9296_c0_g2_i1.p1  ORF type:complete len:561 (+),score=147.24 TRINITY_DN9296_c0_g2_i1:76-1758(+)